MDKKVTNDDTKYFNYIMASIPEQKSGEKHTVKKNENLWNIARSKLGSKAKRSEVQLYMYKIAKLNNKNSIKEINSLKINEELYLPEDTPKVEVNTAQNVNKTNKTNTASTVQTIQKTPKAVKNNAELGFEDLKNGILNCKPEDISVFCSLIGADIGSDLNNYSVKVYNKEKPNQKNVSFCATIDDNGHLKNISFNGRTDEFSLEFDYEANGNGIIVSRNGQNEGKQVGKFDKNEFIQIAKILQDKIDKK